MRWHKNGERRRIALANGSTPRFVVTTPPAAPGSSFNPLPRRLAFQILANKTYFSYANNNKCLMFKVHPYIIGRRMARKNPPQKNALHRTKDLFYKIKFMSNRWDVGTNVLDRMRVLRRCAFSLSKIKLNEFWCFTFSYINI